MDSETMLKMQLMQQELQKIEEHSQAIEAHIQELGAIRLSLIELENSSGKEILANLGKGIFLKTHVADNNLLVNIGGNILVKKTPKQALDIISEQLSKLESGKKEFASRYEQLNNDMRHLSKALKQTQNHSECKECHDDCDCEEECKECKCH